MTRLKDNKDEILGLIKEKITENQLLHSTIRFCFSNYSSHHTFLYTTKVSFIAWKTSNAWNHKNLLTSHQNKDAFCLFFDKRCLLSQLRNKNRACNPFHAIMECSRPIIIAPEYMWTKQSRAHYRTFVSLCLQLLCLKE